MGPDNIPAVVLNSCAPELVEPLAKLFQYSYNTGIYPTRWKTAQVQFCRFVCKKAEASYGFLIIESLNDPHPPVASAIHSTSIILKWELANSSAVRYILQWRYRELPGQWIYTEVVEDTTYNLTELHPYTEYVFRVMWIITDSLHKYSPESHSYRTKPYGVPSSPPVIVRIESPSPSSVVAEWKPPMFFNGPLIGYHIELQSSTEHLFRDADKEQLRYSIYPTKPGTTYSDIAVDWLYSKLYFVIDQEVLRCDVKNCSSEVVIMLTSSPVKAVADPFNVAHQEVAEAEDQEAVSPDILHQLRDEDELNNEGQQEDPNNEMVTLQLEPVNPLRTPSPLLSDTTDAIFHGVQSEAAAPSGLQQAIPGNGQGGWEGELNLKCRMLKKNPRKNAGLPQCCLLGLSLSNPTNNKCAFTQKAEKTLFRVRKQKSEMMGTDAIERRWQQIGNKGASKLKPSAMNKAWDQVAEEFSAVAAIQRVGKQCRKKWQDLGQVVSKKLSHDNREQTITGGGVPNMHPLTPLEMRVADVAHASLNEGQSSTAAPEPVDDEQDLPQHDEEEENWGEQEDAGISEMVTLKLEEVMLEARHIPSPFEDATTEATFRGGPASDVAVGPNFCRRFRNIAGERAAGVGRRRIPPKKNYRLSLDPAVTKVEKTATKSSRSYPIFRMPLDTDVCIKVRDVAGKVQDLQLDPLWGYMYWTTAQSVEYARINGDQPGLFEELPNFSGKQISGLTLDFDLGALYWLTQDTIQLEINQAELIRKGNSRTVKRILSSDSLKTSQHMLQYYFGRLDLSTPHYCVSGLEPFTEFDVAVKPYTYWGSATETQVTLCSPEAAPSAPENPRVFVNLRKNILVDMVNMDVEFRWNVPAQTNGILRGYTVYYTTENCSSPLQGATLINVTADITTFKITDADPKKTYCVQVEGFTNAGSGSRTHVRMGNATATYCNCTAAKLQLDGNLAVDTTDSKRERLFFTTQDHEVWVSDLNGCTCWKKINSTGATEFQDSDINVNCTHGVHCYKKEVQTNIIELKGLQSYTRYLMQVSVKNHYGDMSKKLGPPACHSPFGLERAGGESRREPPADVSGRPNGAPELPPAELPDSCRRESAGLGGRKVVDRWLEVGLSQTVSRKNWKNSSSTLRGSDSIFGGTWKANASAAENETSRPLPPRLAVCPFGIHLAAAIFHGNMESRLKSVACTVVLQDDILITGHNNIEHLHNLEEVLIHLMNEAVFPICETTSATNGFSMDTSRETWKQAQVNCSIEGNFSCVILGLHPSRIYALRTVVTYKTNVSCTSAVQALKTKAGVPGKPGSPYTIQDDINWTKADDNGNNITHYILQAQNSQNGTGLQRLNSSDEWITLYHGPCNNTICAWRNQRFSGFYHMRVVAVNGIGMGEFSDINGEIIMKIYAQNAKHDKQKGDITTLHVNYNPDLELALIRDMNASVIQTNIWYTSSCLPTQVELESLPLFPREKLTLQNFLGSGAFGEVFEGKAEDILGPGSGDVRVAVKTLRKGATDHEKSEFLKEAYLMSHFDHAHIVKLLGVCLLNEPQFLLLELMKGRDLLSYLRGARGSQLHHPLLCVGDLLDVCLDVAKGCTYLEKMHFVHRDLAARNCLVSMKEYNASNRKVKIGDFGLARDIYKNDYYRKEGEGLLPVRWMAPESLIDGMFTNQSDVWSFGILMWEVMTLGQQPYPARTNLEVLHFVRTEGRLEKPSNCPDNV
uniref:proto-oncogene tyrosine-protein kinase ROS-like n=1 Tax=Pristiophorus japonicus TaxID=55135 RepID=UPI00398EDE67